MICVRMYVCCIFLDMYVFIIMVCVCACHVFVIYYYNVLVYMFVVFVFLKCWRSGRVGGWCFIVLFAKNIH